LIILDEPFSSLDLPTRNRLTKILDASGIKLLMISHHFSVFKEFDRLLWIHEGKVQADGQPGKVIDMYKEQMLNMESTV